MHERGLNHRTSKKLMKPRICLLMTIGLFVGLHNASAQTWTQTIAPTNLWSTIACSADGSKLVAGAGSSPVLNQRISPIYVSTNFGATWTLTSAPSNAWTSVASSADGTNLQNQVTLSESNTSSFYRLKTP